MFSISKYTRMRKFTFEFLSIDYNYISYKLLISFNLNFQINNKKRSINLKKKLVSIIIPIAVAMFNVLIIFFPREVMGASKAGAVLWFNNILPSLLPFFIGTNILMGLGAVDFLGILLEPLMRPLFGVPGSGGFALAMGMTSGYPVGAKVSASLREGERITSIQAQRLMSFVNNSGPLFMLGAVGSGMFGSERVGLFILITNFSAAFFSGILFKNYKKGKENLYIPRKKAIVKSALIAMNKARKKDDRTFGKLLADSVFKSLESVIQIGGFIMLFSVVLKVAESIGLMALMVKIAGGLGISSNEAIIEAVIYGFVEVTNGAGKLAALGITRESLILCSALISFGGLSIFAQSIAFLSKTDVKSNVYFFSKIINAVLTAAIGILIYPLFDFTKQTLQEAATVFAPNPVRQLVASIYIYVLVLLSVFISSVAINIACYLKKRKPIGRV